MIKFAKAHCLGGIILWKARSDRSRNLRLTPPHRISHKELPHSAHPSPDLQPLICLYLQWQLFKSETSHRDHRNPRISNLNCLPTIKTGLAFYFIETYTVSRCQQPDESPTYINMAAFFWSLFCSFLTIPSRKRTPMGARKTE